MNPIKVGDRVFDLVRGSDVDRDGMFLEVWEVAQGQRDGPLAEVFHSDVTGAMTFSAYAEDIPFEAIAWLLERARELLPLVRPEASATGEPE
jgi:hypothetical protein